MNTNPEIVFATGLVEVECLYYYDGPLLSHYRDAGGQDYIMMWTDIDEEFEYWFAVQITPEDLKAYFTDQITSLQVLERAAVIYDCKAPFISDENSGTGKIIAFADIPQEQRPTADSWLRLSKYLTATESSAPATPGDAEPTSGN